MVPRLLKFKKRWQASGLRTPNHVSFPTGRCWFKVHEQLA